MGTNEGVKDLAGLEVRQGHTRFLVCTPVLCVVTITSLQECYILPARPVARTLNEYLQVEQSLEMSSGQMIDFLLGLYENPICSCMLYPSAP